MENKPPYDRDRYHRHLCNLSHALCPRDLPREVRLTTFTALKILLAEMPSDYWQRFGDLERRADHSRYRTNTNALHQKSSLEAFHHIRHAQLLTECAFAAAINTPLNSTWSADERAHYRSYQILVIVSCLQLYLIGDHGSAIENALREIRLIATDERHDQVLQVLPQMAGHQELESLIKTLRTCRHDGLLPLVERGIGFLGVAIYDAYRLAKGITRYRKSKKLPTAEHYIELVRLEKTDDTDLVVDELIMHPESGVGDDQGDESPFAFHPKTLRVHDPSSPHQSQFMRAQLNQRFTEQLAVRELSLPCSFEQASDWDIEHLVRDSLDRPDPTGLWLLLRLVCGGIPSGQAIVRKVQKKENEKDSRLCLIIEHKVPAGTLDEQLHTLLPPTKSHIILPLPAALLDLDLHAPPPDDESLRKRLTRINDSHQTRLTLGRITRYLEHWYVNEGIDVMQVALVRGQDFKKRPALAYSNIPANQVVKYHRAYLQYLFDLAKRDAGLPSIRPVYITVGSSLRLPSKVFHNLFNRLLIPPPTPRHDVGLDDLADFHNHYLCYVWALLTFVTGHRDVTAPMGSLADYNPITRTWWISDKEVRNGPAARTLVIPTTAARQIELYQAHLRALGQRYWLLHRKLAQRCDAALDGRQNLLFFILRDHHGHLQPQDATPGNIKQQLASQQRQLPLQHNWARHHLRTTLQHCGLAPSVIDGWMGHEDIGEAIFGRHSGLSISTLRQVAEFIEVHLNFHQIEARAGWQTL